MDRREFLRVMIIGGSGLLLNRSVACKKSSSGDIPRTLPAPQVNTFSSEIVLNTRRSYHSGYSGELSDQILANVLWATGKAPAIGQTRTIYVATSENVYIYDPVHHEITVHEPGNHLSESNLAFEVGVASDLVEDSGLALLYGLLAATSFWTDNVNQPGCCPKESARSNASSTWNPTSSIHNVHCYGRMPAVSGITDELVAVSSNSSLPDPSTNGSVLLENAFANLIYGEQFSSMELTLDQISQIAWASYGCTPHLGSYSHAGLTVPSAMADYYLTGRIYIVRAEGVERFHNRLPGGDLTTRDHRIERLIDGDKRPQLRTAVPRLPSTASVYFVYCAENTNRYQLIEAGYCGASALLQASSIDLQGYITAGFSSAERNAIIDALSIPSGDLPLVIFSVGHADTGVGERSSGGIKYADAMPNPLQYV